MKDWFSRSTKYLKKYPRHYSFYLAFGVGFSACAYALRDSKYQNIRLGFAGSIAQLVTEMTFHPIDTVNTRTKFEIVGRINSIEMTRRIAAKEGFIGYWRGASATFYGALLGGMIYFTSYKYIKERLQKLDAFGGNLRFLTFLISSVVSEAFFTAFYYPFDLIRTRMQTREPHFRYKGMIDAYARITGSTSLSSILQIHKLYLGAAPCFLMNIANYTIMFTVNELLREKAMKRKGVQSVHELGTVTYLTCSALSGGLAGAATNALEVITIHKQIDGKKFNLVAFMRREGVSSLYSGISARIVINAFHCVSLFFVVDVMGKVFNVNL